MIAVNIIKKMSLVEYENSLPQKIRIDRIVEGYGKSWSGSYQIKVIYNNKKVTEGIIPDFAVDRLISLIHEYKKPDKK